MYDLGLVVAFSTVAYLVLMMLFWKPRKSKKVEKSVSQPPTKLTPDDVIHVLDFMLTHNIIDTKQYNELLVKSSPFL